MSSESLRSLPVVRLAALIRSGELSPVELLEAHLTRIDEVDPVINALVSRRFEEARAEARVAEDAVRRGRDELFETPRRAQAAMRRPRTTTRAAR